MADDFTFEKGIVASVEKAAADLHTCLLSIPRSIRYHKRLGAITDIKLDLEKYACDLQEIFNLCHECSEPLPCEKHKR